MGYMTDYRLSVDRADANTRAAILERIKEEIPLESMDGGETYDGWCHWYDYCEDMKDLSASFPDVLFTLSGDGEENDDIWVDYYKGGKVQHANARIEYDDFDETKLR